MEWSLAPGDAETARTIRHRIAECLRRAAADGADLDSAELVVGELLSNVVMHTSSPARISLNWSGQHPEVQVTDDGSVPEHALESLPADPLATNGRGLYLVSKLARTVAVAGSDAGTTITVVLDLDRTGCPTRPRPTC